MPGGGGRRKEGGRYGRRRSAHSTRLAELGRFRLRTPLDLDLISWNLVWRSRLAYSALRTSGVRSGGLVSRLVAVPL